MDKALSITMEESDWRLLTKYLFQLIVLVGNQGGDDTLDYLEGDSYKEQYGMLLGFFDKLDELIRESKKAAL